MAQTHRLFAQVAYLHYIAGLANRHPDELLITTYGIGRNKMSFSSGMTRLMAALQNMKGEARILVGCNGLREASAGHAFLQSYPNVLARFLPNTHAKYAIARFGKRWEGALGSMNLADSNQINWSVELCAVHAVVLAADFYAHWQNADTGAHRVAVEKNIQPLMDRVYKPNSTER